MPYYRVDFEDTRIKHPVSFNVWASDSDEAIVFAKRSMGYCDNDNALRCLAVERMIYVENIDLPTQKTIKLNR